jgi:MOSC domain-containing protein YiiM
MQLLSVNVARPREFEYQGKTVCSAIFKKPASGPVTVGHTNIEGDRQANLAVHGGVHKAVYAYSWDHYGWWARELGRDDLSFGQFGENLTIAGLDESAIHIGDRLQIGTARFAVTAPRIPCSKLAMRFDDKSMPRRFSEAALPGFYLRVLEPGVIETGDEVGHTPIANGSLPVRDLYRAYSNAGVAGAPAVLEHAATLPDLDPALLPNIDKRLRALKGARE